jgi:dCTP deaminase
MPLTDGQIKRRLADGDLSRRLYIGNLADPAKQIQPASVDVRLGNEFIVYTRDEEDDPVEVGRSWVEDGQPFLIHPGQFILATTKETVSIPYDMVGRVEGKSTLGRTGLLVHITAGYLDPGFGRATSEEADPCEVTLEVACVFPCGVPIWPGMCIAQFSFEEMSEPCEVPYGAARGSHYTKQVGPQPSRYIVQLLGPHPIIPRKPQPAA